MFDFGYEDDVDMVFIGPHVTLVGSELDFLHLTGAHVNDIMSLSESGYGTGTTKGYTVIHHEDFKSPSFSDPQMFQDVAEMLEANLGKNWQKKVLNMSKGQAMYY